MNDEESMLQIEQMCSFINLEAKEKADEIANDTKEKCALEKQKIIDKARRDIEREYELLVKRIEVDKKIAESQIIAEQRSRMLKHRDRLLTELSEKTRQKLISFSNPSSPDYKTYLRNCILQGLVKMDERDIRIRCPLSRVLPEAIQMYKDYLKQHSKNPSSSAPLKIEILRDRLAYLSPPPRDAPGLYCTGGVILETADGKIKLDNTLDTRLGICVDMAKPFIRENLFPKSSKEDRSQ